MKKTALLWVCVFVAGVAVIGPAWSSVAPERACQLAVCMA